MLRMFIVFFLLLLNFGCTNINNDTNNYKSRIYAFSSNNFNHQYSIYLFEFSEILNKATNASNETDIAYLDGRIDALIHRGTLEFSIIKSLDKEIMDKLITPELQQPIFKILSDIPVFLQKLQSNVLLEKDLKQLKKIHNELNEISDLTKALNNSSYKKPQNAKQYKEKLVKLENLMQEFNFNLNKGKINEES